MPAILCLLLAMPSWAVNGEGTGTDTTAVLFYYGPEEYYWGNASVTAGADAIEVSKTAAEAINRGFTYDNATGAVTVGGLSPGPNDTWKWTLLSWDPQGARWVPWTGYPRGLRPQSGGAIAWGPSDMAYPAPDPLSRYPWSMDRCTPTRRGETVSPAPATNLTFWNTTVDAWVAAPPCVANGKVFIVADVKATNRKAVLCLDELTGRTIWQAELRGNGSVYSSPAYAEGKVFIGTGDGVFCALNAGDGKEVWSFTVDLPTGSYLSPPVVAGRTVIFSTKTNAIYCLGLEGGLVWKRVPSRYGDDVCGGPAVLDGKVVYGENTGNLTCLDASNGSLIWSNYLGKISTFSTPALSLEGYAFVVAWHYTAMNMTLFSIFIRDGVQQWHAEPGNLVEASPALAGGGLFVGTYDGIAAYHPDRGTKVWELDVGPVDASPTVAQGFVYFIADSTDLDGVMGCVRVGGQPEWTMALKSQFSDSAVIADGRLFAVSSKGTVLCIGRPPEPMLEGMLSVPARAVENEVVKVKAYIVNAGEAPALFSAWLTVDGKPAGTGKGPYTLGPGESLNITFDWTARKGEHKLDLSFNGTAGSAGRSATITVEAKSSFCAIGVLAPAVAACATLVPLVAGWTRRRPR